MSASDPSYTAANVVTQVEADLRTPNLGTSFYLPHVSHAYNQVYQKLIEVGQHVKQEYFGAYTTLSLDVSSPNEYSITSNIPRFGGLIEIQLKYGATGDTYNKAKKLRSMAHWGNWANISTTYRSKTDPLYYRFGNTLGFIPVPPETGAIAKIFYVKDPYQITDGADVIDIPYRFIYPILTYVKARAIERSVEDYATAKALDRQFQMELEAIALAAASEFNEDGDEQNIELGSDDEIYNDPFRQ